MSSNILDHNQFKLMKDSGRILKDALLLVKSKTVPGITTLELDQIADQYIRSKGGIPSFKGYEVRGVGKFPSALCVSIDDEVVHGLPNRNRIIQEGNIVSLDLGVDFHGVCSDSALTLYVGTPSKEIADFMRVTKECLNLGIKEAVAGNHIGAIGHAIQTYAESNGYGVIRDLIGHGIGTKPHMDPAIPNYGDYSEGPIIREGMALAIEPMLTLGGYEIESLEDGWTIATADGSLAAHFEHTVVIINGKPQIVTK